MTRYAFLIDQDTCIGCHACTVACKAEHDVPLGVNRTWVKYIETGRVPRHAAALLGRCGATTATTRRASRSARPSALFRRHDGIVDFDDSPLHRLQVVHERLPVRRPVHQPGDADGAQVQLLHPPPRGRAGAELRDRVPDAVDRRRRPRRPDEPDQPCCRPATTCAVRAPEQGTRPHVFYKGADQAALDPLRTSDRRRRHDLGGHDTRPPDAARRPPGHGQQVVARTTYTTAHPMPWTGKVSAYLVTKAIGAGALIAGGLAVLGGHADERALVGIAAAAAWPLVFAAVTGVLLGRRPQAAARASTTSSPGRNWRSWLVRGAWILAGYGAASARCGCWAGCSARRGSSRSLAAPAVLLAAATAGYTAFLFGQCEGRDLWQTPLLLPTLLAQAAAAGGAAGLLLVPAVRRAGRPARRRCAGCCSGASLATRRSLLAHRSWPAPARVHVELAQPGDDARRRIAGRFWGAAWSSGWWRRPCSPWAASPSTRRPLRRALAGVAAIAGIARCTRTPFVRAGQSVPLS